MPKPSQRSLIALLALTVALAHAAVAATPDQKTTRFPAKKLTPARKPIDPANMDPSVKPGDDFYRYANGKWLEKNPIPASESRWGAFSEVAERNSQILYEILEAAAKKTDAPKGSSLQMVGDFYATAIDSARADELGAKPLAEDLARVAALKNTDELLAEIARFQGRGIRVPFGVFAAQDAKQSTEVILQIVQAGLGMPDRDYYTKTDDASKALRDKYEAHLNKMFGLLGDDAATAAAEAKTVIGIETRLANASLTRVQRRDPEANYHKMTVDELAAMSPALQWPRMLEGMGVSGRYPVNVGQPDFVKAVDGMIASVPLADWRTYLRWHLVNSTSDLLSSSFVNEHFDFYGRTLTGATELRPRWKRARDLVDGAIGEALGQLYVERTFTPQAKARALALVENLRAELRDRLTHLEWMSEPTRQQALRKLNAFAVKIGYPDVWRDYATLTIDRSSLLGNVERATQFEYRRNLAKLGKPVDRKEWGMTPPTVNAYYNPRMNEIVFPAGILQPPFFDANADDAVNYGGIGAVIGHEMTHGFDDQGRKSDADGNLKDWWTAEDAEKYKERSALIEKQYGSCAVLDTLHINGKLTLGENTADIGGLSIAYGALQKALKGKKHEKIEGFTPEQRFFLSFAQIWRNNIRPEALRLRINTDPHSPGEYRCVGTLANMPEFAQAFGLKDGDAMVRAETDRAKIW
jgi:putative endopeptidase